MHLKLPLTAHYQSYLRLLVGVAVLVLRFLRFAYGSADCDGIVKLRGQELQSVKLQVLDREQKFVGQLARDDAPASHS